jgi:hypothetical protein
MRGDLENGFAFAGANAWRVDRIVTVQELVNSLAAEFERSGNVETARDHHARHPVSDGA